MKKVPMLTQPTAPRPGHSPFEITFDSKAHDDVARHTWHYLNNCRWLFCYAILSVLNQIVYLIQLSKLHQYGVDYVVFRKVWIIGLIQPADIESSFILILP
jgi:hypothetical protein